MPILLGDGLRRFDHLDYDRIDLKCAPVALADGVVNLRFSLAA
ncbi:MAG: hypothetical protein ACR2FI_10125 [Burkholderiales bacterium]